MPASVGSLHLVCFQRIAFGTGRHAHATAALQAAAGLDDQLVRFDFPLYPAAGHDFQPAAEQAPLKAAGDQDPVGAYGAADLSAFAYGNLSGRGDPAFDVAIDVEFAGNGQITDKAGSPSDEGRS